MWLAYLIISNNPSAETILKAFLSKFRHGMRELEFQQLIVLLILLEVLEMAYLCPHIMMLPAEMIANVCIESVNVLPCLPSTTSSSVAIDEKIMIDMYMHNLHPINLLFGFWVNTFSFVSLSGGSSLVSKGHMKYQMSVVLVDLFILQDLVFYSTASKVLDENAETDLESPISGSVSASTPA